MKQTFKPVVKQEKSFKVNLKEFLACCFFLATSVFISNLQAQTADAPNPIIKNGSSQTAVKGRTLNDFLSLRRDALLQLQKTPTDQIKPLVLTARTTAEQRSGVRRIRIRGHQIISDSDYSFAGYSLGPGSPESALTVLASDIADTYLSQAALKGVPLDSLGVSITSLPDSVRPKKHIVYPHNLFYTIYVKSSASDEQLEELRLLTEKYSPSFNLVSNKQVIKADIDYVQTPKDLVAVAPYQPGLREYLKYKRAAVLWRNERSKVHSEKANPERIAEKKPQLDVLHVEVDPATGARRLHVRYFNLLHDNPAYLAGNDLGPSAHEHQLAVLTSCITHITEIQAASQNVVLDSLGVSVEGTFDLRAGRPGFENVPFNLHDIHYTLHVRSPQPYKDIVALRDSVEAICPIYNLLISEQKIKGRIVRSNPDKYRLHPQYVYQYKE
ncbi:MAG: OsmC family protein [Bacteroidota bacterium]|nr:OsmC family protein [Bacteroidota bacterium]